MKPLTKDVFSQFMPAIVPVPLPGGEYVAHVRTMSGVERFGWINEVSDDEKDGKFNQAHLIAICLCDEKGERVFGKKDEAPTASDLELIGGKPSTILDAIGSAAMKVNGISSEGKADAKKN